LGAIFNIYAYNRFTHTTKALPYKTTDIPVLKNVYRIFNSSKGVLALAENGIFLIKKGQIADYYGPFSKDKNKYLAIKSFLDVHEDKNNCLWIATNGEGLYKWNWNNAGANTKLEQLTNNDGLSSMVLYRIEEDNSNNLWISSDEGIARLNPINNEIRLFRAEDGLPHHEFNRISSFKAEDGRIFFGALNGVVGFNPLDFKKSNVTHHVPFQVIGITKYSKNKEQVLDWFSGNSNKSIVFLPSDKLIKIEYALLDYKTRKKKYAYRISSVQKDWIYTNDNSLSIGSPPYGNHTIEIMVQLEDGTWLEDSLKIPIAVLRPFYLQIWFLVLSFLVFIGIVLSVIWFRSQRLKAQNANLEQKIIERTKDLQTALGDKDILLKELHHRVKNNLQIITGLLELQKAQLTDKKAIEALNEGQIRLSSIALIHQNFYSGDKLESVSFNSFLNDLVSTVKRMFGTKEHPIESSIKSADISIDINSAIPLGLILNELLTNSYKYLPKNQPNKKIEIELHELEADSFELTYKDNGPGLPENVSFENSKTLGLRLIRGLAQQIKGSVDYKFEKGSVFRVRFKAKSIK
jgi:two-component sensor histidine kinase